MYLAGAKVKSDPKQYDLTDSFQAYYQTLEQLHEITDPIEQSFKLHLFSKNFGIRTSRMEADLKRLRPQQGPEEKVVFDLGEFLEGAEDALPWLVPGMLPLGETVVLASIPKCGKTLLAYDLAYAVGTGDSEFLGESVPQGRVLIVSGDESPRSTRVKLISRGFRTTDKDQVRIMTRFNLAQMGTLERELETFRPLLVIIDSLRSSARSAQISENAAEFGDAIYDLKELLGKYDAAGILIHHESKDKESKGIYKLRGSSSISGAAWGVWQLQYLNPNQARTESGERHLHLTPREGLPTTMKIDLEPENHHWTKQSEESEGSSTDTTLKQRILSLLRDYAQQL